MCLGSVFSWLCCDVWRCEQLRNWNRWEEVSVWETLSVITCVASGWPVSSLLCFLQQGEVAFCQICGHYDDKNYHYIYHFLLFICLFVSAAISDNSFQALLSDILILFLLFFIGVILLKILLPFVSSSDYIMVNIL